MAKNIDRPSYFRSMRVWHAAMLLSIDVGEMQLDFSVLGKIREKRNSKHMTQVRLAEKTGVSVNHVGNIENAKRHISLEFLDRIAVVLDTTIVDLIVETRSNEASRCAAEIGLMLFDCSVT